MEHPAAEGGEHRQHPLEHVPIAAGKDRDVSGGGAMASPTHRTVDGRSTGRAYFGTEAHHLGFVGGRHLGPDLPWTQTGEETVFGFHHGRRRRGRRQTGDHEVAVFRHLPRGVGEGCTGVKERLSDRRIEISDREVEAVPKKRAGKLAADIAETDEPDLHGRPPVVGALVGCGIVRPTAPLCRPCSSPESSPSRAAAAPVRASTLAGRDRLLLGR